MSESRAARLGCRGGARRERLVLANLPEDGSIGWMTILAAVPRSEGRLTIETRTSWAVCLTALGIAAVSFAAPAVVGLKSIAADLGGERSVPAAGLFARLAQRIRRRHRDGARARGWARPTRPNDE